MVSRVIFYGINLTITVFCTVLDDQGTVESEQRYLPYGGERYAAGIDETDYGYTGQRDLQDLGLMDYNARFYSPSIRRKFPLLQ
jgi:hypothetical protein